jgi:two-component system NtrC family response regulator
VILQRALAHSNNRLSQAAKLMGISRPTLYGLLEAHDLAPSRAPAGEEEED